MIANGIGCCLCEQIAGNASGDLLHAYLGGAYERRAPEVADRMSLIPSLGSLVPGHVLLCPHEHVRSFAELGTHELQRVDALLPNLAERLGVVARAGVQLFEHGDAPESDRVSCSVEHAHIHLVPGVPDLWPLARDVARWQSVQDLRSLSTTVGDGEYLALRGRTGGWQVALAPEGGHPSQLLRRLVAEALGERDDRWNWRSDPRLDMTARSWDVVRTLTGD